MTMIQMMNTALLTHFQQHQHSSSINISSINSSTHELTQRTRLILHDAITQTTNNNNNNTAAAVVSNHQHHHHLLLRNTLEHILDTALMHSSTCTPIVLDRTLQLCANVSVYYTFSSYSNTTATTANNSNDGTTVAPAESDADTTVPDLLLVVPELEVLLLSEVLLTRIVHRSQVKEEGIRCTAVRMLGFVLQSIRNYYDHYYTTTTFSATQQEQVQVQVQIQIQQQIRHVITTISHVLHERVQDRAVSVRFAALEAILSLPSTSTTNTTSANDNDTERLDWKWIWNKVEKVKEELIAVVQYRATSDTSASIRAQALHTVLYLTYPPSSISTNDNNDTTTCVSHILSFIIERIRDTSIKVRLASVQVLQKVRGMECYTTRQLECVVLYGVTRTR